MFVSSAVSVSFKNYLFLLLKFYATFMFCIGFIWLLYSNHCHLAQQWKALNKPILHVGVSLWTST